jgi:hypothetical protein
MLLGIIILGVIWFLGIKGLRVLDSLMLNGKEAFEGTEALRTASVDAGIRFINWFMISGIVFSIPFLRVIGFFVFIYALYNLIFAFPLLGNSLIVVLFGLFGDNVLANLPIFMINYYQKYSKVAMDDVYEYQNGVAEEPIVFFTKEAYEDDSFVEEMKAEAERIYAE